MLSQQRWVVVTETVVPKAENISYLVSYEEKKFADPGIVQEERNIHR